MTPRRDDEIPQTPGGGEPSANADGSSSLLPGQARSWTIVLPAGLPLLSLNGRIHHMERYRRSQALKKAAWAMTLKGKVPRLERISVVVEYQPPDESRRRDADNVPAASGKACVDGIVAAGVVPDDESPRYVAEIKNRVGPVYPKGRLVLYVTEVP